MLFVRHFMFFPPGGSTLISFGCLSYGGYYYLKGEALLPPLTPNTFYIQFHRLQKHENKKARNESNNGNPYAGANNYHLTKQHQAAVCLSAQHELRLLWLSLVIMWTPRGLRFCATFDTKSGFAYGWSGANPDSEQTVPACARHIRHGSVSLEQIQDRCPVRRTLK